MIRITDPDTATLPTLRLGIIGAGKRALSYFREVPERVADRIELVAVAEPSDASYDEALATFPGSSPQRFTDGHRLIAESDLDALVVAPPNNLHADLGAAAIARGIPTLLEKPVAIDPDQAVRLWQAHLARPDVPVTVGFPLRHAPFYRRIHDLIATGELGQVLTIDAHELLGTGLTKVFHTPWRNDVEQSGGFLVEKCCHDMDILLWLVGADPAAVFSMAGRDHFRPRPEPEQESRFRASSEHSATLDFGENRTLGTWQGTDAYSTPNGNPDHQSVVMRFANGVLVTFTGVMAQPRNTRTIRVYGTAGSVDGDLDAHVLTVRRATEDGQWTEQTEHLDAPTSGHHGGDRGIGVAFWDSVTGAVEPNPTSLHGGLRAALLAWAAQQSAATGTVVDAAGLMSLVESPTR